MTARPIRRNAQTPDRNGKIFYTSTTSLSHISKVQGYEAAHGGRGNPDRHIPGGIFAGGVCHDTECIGICDHPHRRADSDIHSLL